MANDKVLWWEVVIVLVLILVYLVPVQPLILRLQLVPGG